MCLEAEVCSLQRNFSHCIELLIDAFDSLHDKNTIISNEVHDTFVLTIQGNMFWGEALMGLGKYGKAFLKLRSSTAAMVECRQTNIASVFVSDNRKLYHLISECLFHLGEYSSAISMAEAAIEMNRFYPYAYKYLIESYKALGQWETALIMMHRAIRYESPWDKAHTERLKRQLNCLLEDMQRAKAANS